MTRDQIVAQLCQSIQDLDEQRVDMAVDAAIAARLGFDDAVDAGLARGLREVGARFERGELFLPHLVMAGDMMDKAVARLAETLAGGTADRRPATTVVIGTVAGDIHEIGKNIVALMLRVAGFRVVDIGVDVQVESFIQAAKHDDAAIIGASALLTTTQYEQKKLVEQLGLAGMRGQYKVMVGGGQVTPEWVERIGADGYGKDAMAAVKIARKLVGLGGEER